MKKILITLFGLFSIAYGQTIGYLRYDTVKIYTTKAGGRGSLDVTGAVKFTGLLQKSAGTDSVIVRDASGFLGTVSKASIAGAAWQLTGNSGTTAGTNFIGTTDGQDLVIKANNAEQFRALSSGGIRIQNSTGSTTGVIFKGSDRFIHSFALAGTATNLGQNLFIGLKAGNFTMTGSSGGFGTRNLSIGDSTLFANTTGYRNVAIGVWNATNNTTGFENTTVGANAFQSNTTGRQNTALGAISLESNTTGLRNTAVGFSSMQYGTTAERNVAIGGRAMQNVSTGFANAALGFDALAYNSTADHNTAVGLDALYYSNGTHNTAVGDSTLWGLFGVQLHVGYKNVAIGSRAGYHLGDTYPNYASIFDTAVTFLGANASRDSSIAYATSLQNMTVIGYNARGFASNQVVLGNDDITTTLLKGKVGIGTRTPTATLHTTVTGIAGSVTAGYFESIGATTTNIALRLKAANAVNNIALAIENGEGDVGIGTLTPAATFHTVGTVRMASLGSASTDTTTYKPVGISSLGDVIPMTAWPQQVTATSTTTFTNKRWTARVGSTTSSATPTINTDNVDVYKLTAQAADITSFTSNLSGTPVDGDILEIQITGTAARAITWGSSFVSTTVTLPATTVTTTTLTVIFQYYTTSSYGNNKWHCTNYY